MLFPLLKQGSKESWLIYPISLILLFCSINLTHAATPIASYSFDEVDWVTNGFATDSIAGRNASINGAVSRQHSTNSLAHTSTCAGAQFSGGTLNISGLPTSTTTGDKTSVSFWMYWDGTNSVMPMGWTYHDLWFNAGSFGFNSWNSDIYGISSTGLANSWHHVVAIFSNNQMTNNELYINGVKQTLTQRRSSPNNSRTVVNSSLRIGGVTNTSSYRFSGAIDEFKIYNGALNQTEVDADYNYSSPVACVDPTPQPEGLIASYTFNDEWSSSSPLQDTTGSANGTINGAVTRLSSPASGNKPETCTAGQFNGGAIDISSLPISTSSGDKTSVSFWMYWDGKNSSMPLGWYYHDLWFYEGSFGFNSWQGDIYGISSDGLAGGWHHVVAVFTNNQVTENTLYIDGVKQTLTQRRSSPNNSRAVVNSNLRIGGVTNSTGYRFSGQLDELKIYTGEISQETIDTDRKASSPCHTTIAEYHFDEINWTGSADEVIDASDNNYHGTATNGPTTSKAVPVISSNPGTCRYGQFDGKDDHITLPKMPNLTDNFTITAWVKSTTAKRGARIFVDDDNNSKGYALSLNDPGSGRLRFYSRGVSPVSLDTKNTVVPQDDNWYFVTAVHNSSTKQRFIYVNGDLQASGTYTGTWGTDSGIAAIGGESNASRESTNKFAGDIDEVKVYSAALSENEIKTIMKETHPCPLEPILDHFELSYSKNGLTCLASEVTIRACADADCTTVITDDVDISLSPSTGWKESDVDLSNPITISEGMATLTLSHFSAGDVELAISDPSITPANDKTSCFLTNGKADSDCTITFSNAGFIFDVPPLTACKEETDVIIKAVQTDEETNQCVAAAENTKALSFWSSYVSPVDGEKKVEINGEEIPTSDTGTNINLIFDSKGEAKFRVQYDDAGQLTLYAKYEQDDGLILEGDDELISRPEALVIYNNDSAKCDSDYADCSAFKKAGEKFNLNIKAACWASNDDPDNPDYSDNPATPNFELADSIGIKSILVAPTPGSAGELTEDSFIFKKSKDGIHTLEQTISEVGVFKFSLEGPIYYMKEELDIAESKPIGRFTPDHFKINNKVNGFFNNKCTSFNYSGQTFSYATKPQIAIEASNVNGTITKNYKDDFIKLDKSSDYFEVKEPFTDTLQVGADKTTKIGLNYLADSDSAAVTAKDGVITYTFGSDNYQYRHEANSMVAGFSPAVDLEFTKIQDKDGIEVDSTLLPTLQPTGSSILFGRIALDSAHGSELAPLTIKLRTEYFNGSSWLPNAQDQCTSLSLPNHIQLSVDSVNFQAGNREMTIQKGTTSATLANDIISDKGSLSLSAPGKDNQGYVDIRSNIGADDAYPWLLDINNGEAQSRASFGLFRGDNKIIFRRERY